VFAFSTTPLDCGWYNKLSRGARHESLWIVVGGVFVECVWFRWLFERWLGLALRLLEMSLQPEAPF
jgi:hypothetical protein